MESLNCDSCDSDCSDSSCTVDDMLKDSTEVDRRDTEHKQSDVEDSIGELSVLDTLDLTELVKTNPAIAAATEELIELLGWSPDDADHLQNIIDSES